LDDLRLVGGLKQRPAAPLEIDCRSPANEQQGDHGNKPLGEMRHAGR